MRAAPRSCIELAFDYAMQLLPAGERAAAEAHIGACPECRRELASLARVVDRFVAWPTDLLRPGGALQARLAALIAEETGKEPAVPAAPACAEPEWQKVAAGIECKLLSFDRGRQRISMLVRLAAGARYPPHTHAGIEELYLLDGELWIDDRQLTPGAYNRGEPGMCDARVWSETGCTCLLITSTNDLLQ